MDDHSSWRVLTISSTSLGTAWILYTGKQFFKNQLQASLSPIIDSALTTSSVVLSGVIGGIMGNILFYKFIRIGQPIDYNTEPRRRNVKRVDRRKRSKNNRMRRSIENANSFLDRWESIKLWFMRKQREIMFRPMCKTPPVTRIRLGLKGRVDVHLVEDTTDDTDDTDDEFELFSMKPQNPPRGYSSRLDEMCETSRKLLDPTHFYSIGAIDSDTWM